MMFGVASQAFLGHVIGGLVSVLVWFLSAEKEKKKVGSLSVVTQEGPYQAVQAKFR
jgi:hypothetical protein